MIQKKLFWKPILARNTNAAGLDLVVELVSVFLAGFDAGAVVPQAVSLCCPDIDLAGSPARMRFFV